MIGKHRPRWLLKSAVTASLALALAACGPEYPHTTFAPLSELGESIDEIWDILLLWGMIVFVLVEAALIYIVIRYRHKENTPEPMQIEGHTKLEILWTMIPAVILLFIAAPTVRIIFETQSPAPADALQIDVRGHQWWWEFEYPEYGIKTANELYIPSGRAVNLNISTFNVLHSFWIPRLAGKRDAVNRRTNHIWFTANDSVVDQVFNGSCTEFCGESHGNMQFRVFVLGATNFDAWVAHQRAPAVFPPPATPAAASAATAAAPGAGAAAATQDSVAVARAPVYEFPRDRVPDYAIPKMAYPDSVKFDDALVGDAARGLAVFSNPALTTCISCHTVTGNPIAAGTTGPNLTHIGSRTTIAGAMFPATREYVARWLKNAPAMKPGSLMPPQGQGLVHAISGVKGNLTDQQIADVVAYLMSLK